MTRRVSKARAAKVTAVERLVYVLHDAQRVAETLDFMPAGRRCLNAVDEADSVCFELLDRIAETPAETVEDVLLKILTMLNNMPPQELPTAPALPAAYFIGRYQDAYSTHLWVYHLLRDAARLAAPALQSALYHRRDNDRGRS